VTAVEVKGKYQKIRWEIVGIYRAPNKEMLVLEKLADRTGYTGLFEMIFGVVTTCHTQYT